ncbi:TetR/AcrR family transcriptional regulator [Streptomyces sp. CMB-StM0423]|uniref:TetR/AcrR family transcriptional regulator n=1 Tax=Streptomyces sp. CMB-StM0423 TaxID=2059884 RepID=UPI000C712FC6|nr:TetR/AcrR family transcriptional regulator [Streptomyces sp. CMB-StM0423]AUH39918.1 TetR family transcriptional regulator [Streptomyces sp. CMB-StM0423]
MTVDERPAPPPSLRERRRTVAVREIVDAAEAHITEHGPAALSLRAVARGLGMTVQALYHYFPSRDALLTTLITKTYDDLAAAVQEAADAAGPGGGAGFAAATEGYRRWAVANPERFQLIYGTPLRYYAAPAEGPTTQAVRRMSAVFEREMFRGYGRDRLAAAGIPPLSPELHAVLDGLRGSDPAALPPAAVALLFSAWGHMHGLVVLEVFGHTAFLGDHRAELFRLSMHNLLTDIRRRIPDAA